jgi:hypothetical protein
MTTQAQTLLEQLRALPRGERTLIAKELYAEEELELIEHIETEISAGRMRTWTRAESEARWKRRENELIRANC